MVYLLYSVGAIICCGAIGITLCATVNYRLNSSHLVIYCLGIPVRQFALKDMISISKRRRFRAEFWVNTLALKHRKLVIRRERGLFRELIITPRYRYVFRKQLEEAVEGVRSESLIVENEDN
ncbi:MAG: hypothetical protein HN758_08200 [Verrucomicrobia bacterium]|jgi:hypothetical protein|nr:hypothetical protein [Verrucomicrobiota bacterium]MBT4276550.1 hypothetical protein [Verrucomicrobiota bacterium]MBT5061137.1 hypothetical protein [Verrucomicrobiota bacterium]MBT5480896.1 hypothetical protein [Verrucomicrobiota bacterium]MBT6238179.1 hypothetical protein [Verrucomicrobiota bacterium]